MTLIRYFAYGSNMLRERLEDRCRSARLQGLASAEGYALTFYKRSMDGSGKAMLSRSGIHGACVYGVLYDIDEGDLVKLDKFEGVGQGYAREMNFGVVIEQTRETPVVMTYMASLSAVDTSLQPYDWYLALVLAGARQNSLPESYIEILDAVPTIVDPDNNRKTRLEALHQISCQNLEEEYSC